MTEEGHSPRRASAPRADSVPLILMSYLKPITYLFEIILFLYVSRCLSAIPVPLTTQ